MTMKTSVKCSLVTTSAMFTSVLLSFCVQTLADYTSERERILNKENETVLGANLVLNDKEKRANEILLRLKKHELDDAYKDSSTFAPSQHFFEVQKDVEKSQVFQFIRKMPKGASLHSHLTASVNVDFVMEMCTTPNLYACEMDGKFKLQFFAENHNESSQWKLLQKIRKKDPSFDAHLKERLTLVVDDPRNTFQQPQDIWKKFGHLFSTIFGLHTYKPVFEKYVYQALLELYQDQVYYSEFRVNIVDLYDLEGNHYGPKDFVEIFKQVVANFKLIHPKFFGVKLIYSIPKIDLEQVSCYLETFFDLRKSFPEVVAGLDFIGNEEASKPLKDFVELLLPIKENVSFFFHAGETNWYGSDAENNLIDSVLLGSKRIGHGYAIVKHPEVLNLAKENDIALEVSPISNQVLMLVQDLRNHPASVLIAQGYPIVICNDDPGFWGATGLTYDWYLAFLAMTPRNTGLTFLKQLAINSIHYSALSDLDKIALSRQWNAQWDEFIDKIIRDNKK